MDSFVKKSSNIQQKTSQMTELDLVNEKITNQSNGGAGDLSNLED